MQPWTVDAWIAFLRVLVDTLDVLVWPFTVLASLWVFRTNLGSLISRIKRATPGSVEFDTFQQKLDEPADGLSAVLGADYGQNEEHLRPWLERIRGDIRGLDSDKAEHLTEILVEALAIAQQRADFYDILMRIFGSQVQLLRALRQSGFVTSTTIGEHYELYLARGGDENRSCGEWVAFLTHYELARGDIHRLESTLHGSNFVQFLDSIEFPWNSRPL